MADRIGQMALLNDHTWLGSKGWRFDGVQDVLQDLLHGGAQALFTSARSESPDWPIREGVPGAAGKGGTKK